MVGAEVVVGYLFAWVVRKARRVGERADGQVDAALDAGVDRFSGKLHDLVAGRPGGQAALERLNTEAQQGAQAPSAVTTQWVAAVVQDGAERDGQFAATVEALVAQLQAAQSGGGGAQAPGGVAVSGQMDVRAEGGSVAAGVIHGGVQVGNPPSPGPSTR